MKPITVSAVIATFNRAHYLTAALDSLLNQIRPPDEIIVVDDGSTDDTAALLQAYAGKIRVIRQENAGKPAALNKAIPQAKSSHIWIFDDDDVALPDALASHVAFLQVHDDVDFSFSQNFTFDGDGDIWDKTRWRRGRTPDLREDRLLVALMKRCNLVFQALLVPARCFKAAGYFDETMLRAEDYDMLLKLTQRFTAGDIGRPTFVWRKHSGVRGTAGERHSASDRAALFRQYERRIFRSVWENLTLEEYLPVSAQSEGVKNSPENRVRALVQRSDIMFRHDLTAEAALDLQQAIHVMQEAGVDARLVDSIASIVSHAANVDDPVFAKGVCRRAHNIALGIRGRSQKQLSLYALKGFYWALRRALSQQHWAHAMRFACAIIVFGSTSIKPAVPLVSLPEPQVSR